MVLGHVVYSVPTANTNTTVHALVKDNIVVIIYRLWKRITIMKSYNSQNKLPMCSLKNFPPIFFLLACNIIEHTSPLFSSVQWQWKQHLSWVQISIKITIFFFFFLLNFIHFSCMSAFFLSWVMWWIGHGWNTSNRAGIDGGVMSVKSKKSTLEGIS